MDKAKILNLLDQIIEKAEHEDLEHKRRMLSEHKAQKTVGKSWMVHHLNILKELIDK